MKFRYTIGYVDDVAATLAFYRQAFNLSTGFLHDSGDYGELITGDTKLAFSSKALMRSIGKNPGTADPTNPVFEIALETDDVEAALARAITAGATLIKPATTMDWGQTIAYVSDLNGYLIEICTPVGQ